MKSFISKMKPSTRKNLTTILIMLAVYGIVQLLLTAGLIGSLYRGLLVPVCVYIILALSLNIVVGFLGELSLGHAGFMCVGAYTSSMFSICTQNAIPSSAIRFTLALLVGAFCAMIFGIIVGIPVLRLNGDYLAIVTLAFGEIVKNLVNSLYIGFDQTGLHLSMKDASLLHMDTTGKVILNGAQGISDTPKDSNFTIAFLLTLVTIIVIMTLTDSKTGRAIAAIRDNRIAAESIGINISKYKLIAFVISSVFAGIAGVLYSHNYAVLTATTNNFGYNQSIMALVFVVLGGMGNLRGTVVATAVLYILPELLRKISPAISDYRMLIYSVVLVAMMIFSNNPRVADFTALLKSKLLFKRSPDMEGNK